MDMKFVVAALIVILLLAGGWFLYDRQTRTEVRVVNDSGAPLAVTLFWNDRRLAAGTIAAGGDWTFAENMPGDGGLRLSWADGRRTEDLGYVTRNHGQKFVATIGQNDELHVSVDGRPAPG